MTRPRTRNSRRSTTSPTRTTFSAGSTIVIPADSQPAAPAVPVGDRAVQVQPGDTLSGIAQRELGDAAAYPELAAVNHLPDPDII